MTAPKLILVTGGAGFIGSHLCERLVADGHRVISLDNYFTGSRENHVPGVEYREGHTKDIEALVPETPDVVFHLGEYSRVEKSFEDVELVWDLNKLGTFAVLEFVRRRGCKIIYAGSSTKFGDDGAGRDQSPYAWSKATNTELVRNYGEWYGMPFAITYFYNVYGSRERAGAYGTLIEIFRQNTRTGRPLTVVAPGTQLRNFTHIDDIVDGLVRVGENGSGDEYGIGSNESFSILEVAKLYGGEVIMLPERKGNRTTSEVHSQKTRELGWEPKQHLTTYIESVRKVGNPVPITESRILVFTTTFHPVAGPAEDALLALAKRLPNVHFDIITAAHTKSAFNAPALIDNITVYPVGFGIRFDKYLLPILGRRKAFELADKHTYLFSWSLMASYGAFPAIALRRNRRIPLLITLADQELTWYERLFLRFLITRSDQVYASLPSQGAKLSSLESRMHGRRSLGEGDAFANQIRFAYSQLLTKS